MVVYWDLLLLSFGEDNGHIFQGSGNLVEERASTETITIGDKDDRLFGVGHLDIALKADDNISLK